MASCAKDLEEIAAWRDRLHDTNWSLIYQARGSDGSVATHSAISNLCAEYWSPTYYYVRFKGYKVEDAEDLTQEFFSRLLERKWLQHVDQTQGKFRSFWMVLVKRFLADSWDQSRRQKRGGGYDLISLEDLSPAAFQRCEPVDELTPSRINERAWALALFDRARLRMDDELQARGHSAEGRELLRRVWADHSPSYAEAAVRLQISEGNLRVIVHRLRKRFYAIVREDVTRATAEPRLVADELKQLYTILCETV